MPPTWPRELQIEQAGPAKLSDLVPEEFPLQAQEPCLACFESAIAAQSSEQFLLLWVSLWAAVAYPVSRFIRQGSRLKQRLPLYKGSRNYLKYAWALSRPPTPPAFLTYSVLWVFPIFLNTLQNESGTQSLTSLRMPDTQINLSRLKTLPHALTQGQPWALLRCFRDSWKSIFQRLKAKGEEGGRGWDRR